MNNIQLPDSLIVQLRSYEARLRRMETIAAVTGGLAGLLITYVLLFAADRFVNTPIVARIVLTLSGAILAALFAQGWARYWLWNRRGPADLAKLLQKHFRVLGDRLQGVIELTETKDLPENISPALLRAAIRQVAEDSGRQDFTQAVPTQSARRWALAAVLVGALVATPFVLAPRAASNAAQRWVMPWADIERYTFTTVEDLPRELFVPHGEKFELAVDLREDSVWKPSQASARIGAQERLHAEVQEGKAVFKFPGQTKEGVVDLRFGDFLKEIAVHPLHRPELKALAAHVQLPDYLGYPGQKLPLHGSAAEFLTGSKVAFEGTISRNIGTGSLGVGDKQHAATANGLSFTTPALPLQELGQAIVLRWTDIHGLSPMQPYHLRIGASKDAEPRVELQGMQEQELAILPHEEIRLTLAASDDYGLREMWVAWTTRRVGEKGEAAQIKKADKAWLEAAWSDWVSQSAKRKAKPTGPAELPRISGSHTDKELVRPLVWAPAQLGVPQDSVVELTGYALDFFPERAPVSSWKYTIYVLSPEKHAERIRERMDQVLKQLDERIRDEERALEEAKTITENKKDLNSERTSDEIRKVEASEKANEEALQKLTEQMAEVMKDALRNKEILHDTLNEWSKIHDTLAEKAAPEMQGAQQQMAQASQSQQQREQQMQKAQEHQQNALNAMREAASKMQTTNENLFARNFYNRLRHAASSELQISDGLKRLAKMTVGLRPDEIAEGDRKEFDGVGSKQETAVKDVDSIQNDMSSFLRRVQNEKYQAVVSEMEDTRVVTELNELTGFIKANLGLKSVGRAKAWGDQLNKWAEMIQSECECKGGGGEMDPDLMELMIAMVRAAVAQDGIREQTTELDRQKEVNATYTADSAKLGVTQNQLAGTVKEIEENPKFGKFMQEVGPVLGKVRELMAEVSGDLQKPKTDQETVATQGIVIELLVPPDKKGGKQSQSMAQMQRRMQQMMQQMTRARTAGRNNAKAASTLAGTSAEGPAAGRKTDGRTVEKSGGAANAGDLPEEFRDALQSYFQQVEERSN
jgi:hypothetical protein